MEIKTLFWKNKRLYLLDQTVLPHRIKYLICKNHREVFRAIKKMIVRGAPAIGITAAYGIALATFEKKFKDNYSLLTYIKKASKFLLKARPTAVNLYWALNRMNHASRKVAENAKTPGQIALALEKEAEKIHSEDVEMNRKISKFGASLLKKNSIILTHCNAGALATGGVGTALGVIIEAHRQGKIKMVYADETRPYLQGARLTMFELMKNGVPSTLITDNTSGHIMKTEKVDAVIVGADRIASNGDTANKIGTYSLAVLAKYHKVKMYVAAPSSTIDFKISSGREIPIEERSTKEVTHIKGKSISPAGARVRHPAFDITPANLITAIITEKGVYKYPFNLK
ncbi:MAG: S-methyl-5-thioribose-1-phosphate isomerase [Elusimicrobiota bacterium]